MGNIPKEKNMAASHSVFLGHDEIASPLYHIDMLFNSAPQTVIIYDVKHHSEVLQKSTGHT